MSFPERLLLLALLGTFSTCAGGGAAPPAFRLLAFREAGLDGIARNRILSLRFSAPPDPTQDFAARLRLREAAPAARVPVGAWLVVGEQVRFVPRLPTRADESDAGFRADAAYVFGPVAGADALRATTGEPLGGGNVPGFRTGVHFADDQPGVPPRVERLLAVGAAGATVELAFLEAADAQDSAALLAAGNVLDPDDGPWRFELAVDTALAPASVDAGGVRLVEIAHAATTSGALAEPAAPAGHRGQVVAHAVPTSIDLAQSLDGDGRATALLTVRPSIALTDNTRFRLDFAGTIVGIDRRAVLPGTDALEGGRGWAVQLIVRDRPERIVARTIEFDPDRDGIHPETGATVLDPGRVNTALYDAPLAPATALGRLGAFGDGRDGDLVVEAGETRVLDTGDVAYEPVGPPLDVHDPNPDDDYLGDPRPGGTRRFERPRAHEWHFRTVHVLRGGTLRIVGVNPARILATAEVRVAGTIDVRGRAGEAGGGVLAGGGAPGAGGFAGADARAGSSVCRFNAPTCSDFSAVLDRCAAMKTAFPYSLNGSGPGRGMAGGEAYVSDWTDDRDRFSGTGGGGGSNAEPGGSGEDRLNVGGVPGTAGPACADRSRIRNSGVVGVRGSGGSVYGNESFEANSLGGSGGGAGGSVSAWGPPKQQAGGAGGGGGGSLAILAAGPISLPGGRLLAGGGDGGSGALKPDPANPGRISLSGGGGGGSGGAIFCLSGALIDLTGGTVDVRGGTGGARADTTSLAANAGGEGGAGHVTFVAALGVRAGTVFGRRTDLAFDLDRFPPVTALTELFPAGAAEPRYLDPAPGELEGTVHPGQSIRLLASNALADPDRPHVADPTSESTSIEFAVLDHAAGATRVTVIPDALGSLPADRRPYLRLEARFEFTRSEDAVLGPFPAMRRLVLRYRFNGPRPADE